MDVTGKHRKFKFKTSCFSPPNAREIHDKIGHIYDIKYIGVCIEDSSIFVYVYAENVIVTHKMNQLIRSIDIDILSTMVYTEMIGTLLTEYGTRPKKRGPVKKDKRKRKSITPPPTSPSPPVASSSSETPPTKKPRKESSTLIPEDIYGNRTVNPLDPRSFDETQDSFHAIWSSTENGLWHPAMWVGPSRNIVPSKRTSIKKCVINDLMSDQDRECRLCDSLVYMGTYSNSDVDHIIPLKYGGTSNPSNLQILCVTCHRRKTALECKKLVTMMGDSSIDWKDKVYLTNTHVHYEPRTVPKTNPKDFLVKNGSTPCVSILEY